MKELQLKRSKPEQHGVKSEAILNFINGVEQCRTKDMAQDFHSFMLLRHGFVIAEGWWGPYQKEMPHSLFSLSKSFTSTAIGFAVAEGLLTVEDYVTTYFKEECPNPTGYLAQMKVKHLLSMSTGHVVDTTDFLFNRKDGNWIKAFLEVAVEKEPGTYFLYNTGATYMLSVILQRITGLRLFEYLRPRLFEPLGILNPTWEVCPMGYNTGGFGLSIKTEDIAKLGQLYLDQGVFNGNQILPREWVEEATSVHISNGNNPMSDWCQGYGYQFWHCRHDAFRGDGAFGQYCIVMPEWGIVMAITGGMKDMQIPLDILWDNLLPGITDGELPECSDYNKLIDKLNSLNSLLPEGQITSKILSDIAGKSFQLDENMDKFESLAFDFDTDCFHMTIGFAGRKLVLEVGIGQWKEGYLEQEGRRVPVMLTGIWQEETTLLIQCRYIETPFAIQYRCNFKDNQLFFTSKANVGFEEPKWNEVLGR